MAASDVDPAASLAVEVGAAVAQLTCDDTARASLYLPSARRWNAWSSRADCDVNGKRRRKEGGGRVNNVNTRSFHWRARTLTSFSPGVLLFASSSLTSLSPSSTSEILSSGTRHLDQASPRESEVG